MYHFLQALYMHVLHPCTLLHSVVQCNTASTRNRVGGHILNYTSVLVAKPAAARLWLACTSCLRLTRFKHVAKSQGDVVRLAGWCNLAASPLSPLSIWFLKVPLVINQCETIEIKHSGRAFLERKSGRQSEVSAGSPHAWLFALLHFTQPAPHPPPLFPFSSGPSSKHFRGTSARRGARIHLGAPLPPLAPPFPSAHPLMAASAEPSDKAEALLKRLVLRLDDGTMIKGSSGEGDAPAATVLRPAEAYASGALTEAHLLKAQALLCEVHAKLPEEGPLRSLSMGSKRSVDTGFEVRAAAGPPLPLGRQCLGPCPAPSGCSCASATPAERTLRR
jgi:hypothetical protein